MLWCPDGVDRKRSNRYYLLASHLPSNPPPFFITAYSPGDNVEYTFGLGNDSILIDVTLTKRYMVGGIQPCKNLTEFDILPSFVLPTEDWCSW